MCECVNAIDTTCESLVGHASDPLSGACNAADCAQNPDLVARADLSVRAPIAHECGFGRCGLCLDHSIRFVTILIESGKPRDDVVRVNVRADSDIALRASDRPTVLAHGLRGCDGSHRELVPTWNRLEQCDLRIAKVDRFAGGEIAKCDGHIITRSDAI